MAEVLVRGVPQHPATLKIDNGRPVYMEGKRIIVGVVVLMGFTIYAIFYDCLDYFKKRIWSTSDGRIIRIVLKWNTPFPIVSFFPSNRFFDTPVEFEGGTGRGTSAKLTTWLGCAMTRAIHITPKSVVSLRIRPKRCFG